MNAYPERRKETIIDGLHNPDLSTSERNRLENQNREIKADIERIKLGAPLPDAVRQRLASELADLKRDLAAARYSSDDRLWRDMDRKWAAGH